MKSTCPFVLAFLCSALALPAFADVTLKQKTGGKGMGVPGAGESTQYVKGLKIRIDQSNDGKMTSTVMDASGKRMFMLNHEKKEADVYDMAKIGESLAKMPISDIRASVTPTAAQVSRPSRPAR